MENNTKNMKLVNITSKVAIRTVTPKICGTHKNVLMSVGDILRCICMRAHVEEILPDGTTIVLNSNNYRNTNSSKTIDLDSSNANTYEKIEEKLDNATDERIAKNDDSVVVCDDSVNSASAEGKAIAHDNRSRNNKNGKKKKH